MNEYKITFKAESGLIFKTSIQGMDVVKADSAEEAMTQWNKKNALDIFLIKENGVRFSVLGIEKI